MKEMSALQGGMMSFYGEMPDSYNFVVNTAHPVIEKLINLMEVKLSEELRPINEVINSKNVRKSDLKSKHNDKKQDEINQDEKDELTSLDLQLSEANQKKEIILLKFASENKSVRQLVDLALLANNMLKGEALANFVKRSVELM
jgi:molecular chaperone HtpG